MIVLEYLAYGKTHQYSAISEALRTVQFVRNKCLRYWMDNKGVGQKELYRYNTELRAEFPFVKALNSHACQASVERAYSAIARFYANCRSLKPGKKGYPQFQKNNRSVEYKTSGWQLSPNRKSIVFTDKKGIGKLKLKGTRDLNFYRLDQIKRVRIVRRADGYYVQFCVRVERKERIEPSGRAIGLDVGLSYFYTDSNNHRVENPRFLRVGERRLKKVQRRVSRKVKGSNNRAQTRQKLGKQHLKISRQRKDHAVKLARCVITSNDVVAYEDLRVKNMARNHCLAKSINDASWYQFRVWLEYLGKVFDKITIAVPPQYTSTECSSCGTTVTKSLSVRTHVCRCGCSLDRDHNAAINILRRGLRRTRFRGSLET
ncbi:MAG: transposase [Cyanobacteriota bacterium]|nr:transposase [Cyanobacteriota bacterium]